VVNAILTAWDWGQNRFFYRRVLVIDLIARLKLAWSSAGVAIAGFIGDMKVSVLMILQNMVNGAIDIINGFINTLNKIPFVSIDLIEHVTFGTMAALENEAAKQAREAELDAQRAEINAGIEGRAAELAAMKQNAVTPQLLGWPRLMRRNVSSTKKKKAESKRLRIFDRSILQVIHSSRSLQGDQEHRQERRKHKRFS